MSDHYEAEYTDGEKAEVDLLCEQMATLFEREDANPRLALVAVQIWMVGLLNLIECPGCRKVAYERLTTQLPKMLADTMARHGDSTTHMH